MLLRLMAIAQADGRAAEMTITTTQSFNTRALPAAGSLMRALDTVNFFVAASLAGFGPFVAVFLGQQNWSQEEIGLLLSVGATTGLLAQVPGGELLDAIRPTASVARPLFWLLPSRVCSWLSLSGFSCRRQSLLTRLRGFDSDFENLRVLRA